MFSPDPEPHTAIGSCPADYVIPIQRAKSQIMRDTLDSLGHAIFPRMGVVEGQVNIDDVLKYRYWTTDSYACAWYGATFLSSFCW